MPTVEPTMKRYLLSFCHPGDVPPPSPERLRAIMSDVEAARADMKAAGAWVLSDGLHAPSTATVVRARGDEVLITDGPFAEGKEHIGGLAIVRARDLDAALVWAKRLALATGLPIEARPFVGDDEA